MQSDLISCDDHFDMQFLPPDLWTSRVADVLKENM